jgi:hypothetical protein
MIRCRSTRSKNCWQPFTGKVVTCSQCRDTFKKLPMVSPALRAKHIDESRPGCQCESHSVSQFSPGQVLDDELLVRLLVAPSHMDRKGNPRASALTQAESGGMSMFRDKYASDAIIREKAINLVDKGRLQHGTKAGIGGVLLLRTEIVRGFVCSRETDRSYCVYDTAARLDESHAEAFQRVTVGDIIVHEERRKELFKIVFHSFVKPEAFRSGLLADLIATMES